LIKKDGVKVAKYALEALTSGNIKTAENTHRLLLKLNEN
jgi:hypothetical protein